MADAPAIADQSRLGSLERLQTFVVARRSWRPWIALAAGAEPFGKAQVMSHYIGPYASSSNGSKCGWNQICATSVGATALPITAVTRIVYCSWLMM